MVADSCKRVARTDISPVGELFPLAGSAGVQVRGTLVLRKG